MRQPARPPAKAATALRCALAGALLLAATLTLLACGGSNRAAGAGAEQARERSDERKLAEFAKCLREHGLDASTAGGPGGHGSGLKVTGKAGAGPVQLRAAQQACNKYQPEPRKLNLSPQEKVEREEAVLAFAKCMRAHGIDVHASTTGGTIGIEIHGSPGGGGPNPESPAFQSAQNACSKLLPGKPGGPPRGGGPGPSTSTSKGSGSGSSFGITG